MCADYECKMNDKCICGMVCADVRCPAYLQTMCSMCINDRACSKSKKERNMSEAKQIKGAKHRHEKNTP